MTPPRAIPVAVTGLGCLCAAGGSLGKTFEAILAGRRRCAVSGRVRTDHPVACPVFELAPGDMPAGYRDGPESFRCGLLAEAAAGEALGQAGLEAGARGGMRIGVSLGTTVGNAMNNEAFYREFHGGRRPGMTSIRAYLRSNPAAMVARKFGLRGPRQTIANACSSGTAAIGQAAGWIRAGLCDAAVAGGADMMCRTIYTGFISLLITDEKPCRPFDVRRKGLNLGEGAGVVLLESPEHAARRGAAELARLVGYGNASDAYHLSAPAPDGAGLRRAVAQALGEAGLAPEQIGFINAHGTATPDNDRVEGRLFAEMFPGVPFSSTKGCTGHTLGAAGGIEAALTVESLRRGMVPPSAGFEQADPECVAAPVTAATEVDARYAMSDSLAFGGNNAAVIFEREGR